MSIESPKRILIVEDEQIVALDLKMRLEGMGYEVVGHAAMGEDSFEIAANNQPQLLLMDIKLAGNIDGIQTAELMRTFYNIPVIYITAFADTNTLERAKKTRPYGYIIKPFTDQELKSNIEMAFYNHKADIESENGDAWLEAMINITRDAVIAVDEQANIKFMNSIAEEITGHTQNETVGSPVYDVFTAFHLDENTPITNIMKDLSPKNQSHALRLITATGREMAILCRATTIKNPIKEITGVLLIFHEVIHKF